MTDYAKQDVDSLRAIAPYCGGTEYGIFLDGRADRMEDVIADVVQPVFTREDVVNLRRDAEQLDYCYPTLDCAPPIRGGDATRDLAERIEQTLPIEAAPVDVT